VHINPYGEDAVLFAIALLRHPPATAAELESRCRAVELMIEQPVTDGDLHATREFLTSWLEVVDATDFGTRADRLNRLLAGSSAHPRLSNHADDGWHIHYRGADLPLAWLLRTLISVGTALHLAGRGMHRLGRCADPGCAAPFADMSRTGRQRYCSTTCANRDAVRRHRARAAA
jgi:predicted RNA-binding Zn ribbon-like protein